MDKVNPERFRSVSCIPDCVAIETALLFSERMNEKKYSAFTLSKMARVSHVVIQDILSGAGNVPLTVLARVAAALDMKLELEMQPFTTDRPSRSTNAESGL